MYAPSVEVKKDYLKEICSPGSYGLFPGRMQLDRAIHCSSFSCVHWRSYYETRNFVPAPFFFFFYSWSAYYNFTVCRCNFEAFKIDISILYFQKKWLPGKNQITKKYPIGVAEFKGALQCTIQFKMLHICKKAMSPSIGGKNFVIYLT